MEITRRQITGPCSAYVIQHLITDGAEVVGFHESVRDPMGSIIPRSGQGDFLYAKNEEVVLFARSKGLLGTDEEIVGGEDYLAADDSIKPGWEVLSR